MRQSFQPWQKAFIQLAYPVFPNRVIADYLGRSAQVINNFATRNGFRRPRPKAVRVGKRYDRLVVMSESARRRITKTRGGKSKYWWCQCDCGSLREYRGDGLVAGRIVSCGCSRWSPTKHVSGAFYNIIKQNARRRNIPFEVTIEYIDDLYERQGGICALTGQKLVMKRNIHQSWKDKSNTASLDRIDSRRGYIEGNLQWVHKKVNVIKFDMTQEEFVNLCRMVVDHAERRR